jgi:predicted RNA-binding protein
MKERETKYWVIVASKDHVKSGILPLIDDLHFIRNKQSWGYSFRFGFFEINQHDFDLISSQMLQHHYA